MQLCKFVVISILLIICIKTMTRASETDDSTLTITIKGTRSAVISIKSLKGTLLTIDTTKVGVLSHSDSARIARSISFLDAEAANAKDVTGWCLSVLGGSILVFIGTSYIKPVKKKARYIYLLFLPGWYFLGNSFYRASDIISVSIYDKRFTHQPDIIKAAVDKVYGAANSMYHNLYVCLCIFGLWLVTMLMLWIFQQTTSE